MSEIDELRTQVDELRMRVAAMEANDRARSVRRKQALKAVAPLACVLALCAYSVLKPLNAQTAKTALAPSVLNCSALNIVDDSGQPVITLGHDAQGGVIDVNDAAGAARVRAGIGDSDQGELVSLGKSDSKRFEVTSDSDGGVLRVCGNDGQFRTLIACQTGDPNAGLINIRDEKGNQRVNIGSDLHGGVLTLGSEDETILSRLGTDARGGNFYLYGPDHRAHVVMATGDGNAGLINTRDDAGHNRVILGYDNAGGQVIVDGADAKPRAGLVVGDDGAGALSLFDKDGNLVNASASLPVPAAPVPTPTPVVPTAPAASTTQAKP